MTVLNPIRLYKTGRTGVLFLWQLKDLLQSPKARASAAQRTPKRVGVNWMTQSISIKDFKALIPRECVEEIEISSRRPLLWACSK